ncbi:MAG: FecR domain-containing protein [Deltaproteobacteria bacterium]|nr:FecR domain-containing protein [Deltaproteobacteria bacterium]
MMIEESRDVEELIEAMRERGRTSEPLRLASFEEMMATVRRMRRRRRLLWGAATLAAAGVATVVAALLLQEEPKLAAGGTSTPPTDRPAAAASHRSHGSELRRLEPFPDVVAFADEETQVAFSSAERVVLAAGTVVLQLRSTGSRPRLVIETPAAMVAIKGTVLAVSVEAGGTGVEVLRGRVEVARAGRTTVVGEGQRLRPGAAAPEPLPRDRSERLASLFPDERPCTPATATGPAAPLVVSRSETEPSEPSDHPAPPAGEPGVGGDVVPPDRAPAPPDLDETYRLAEEALRAKRYGEARDLLRELVARVPAGGSREETALIDLAQTCRLLGDTACARESLVRYLERHPSGALRQEARLDLCGVLEQSGPASELTSCLREYLAEFPEGRKAQWARDLLGGSPPGRPEGDGV